MSRAVFLDTNVWIDYFESWRPGHLAAKELLSTCMLKGYKLASAACSVKDVHYILQADAKHLLRSAGLEVGEKEALVAKDQATACVDALSCQATLLATGHNDIRMARSLGKRHSDFEDNIVVAVALRANPLLFVTSDQDLIQHAPLPAVSVSDALAFLQGLETA